MTRHELTSGWQVVMGLLLFAGMTTILAAIAEDVMTGAPLTLLDAQLSNWLHASRTPNTTEFFAAITWLGSGWVACVIAAAVCIYLRIQRRKAWFIITLVAIFGGMLLNRILKEVFQRARPHLDDPILSFTGYSFPSGHTMTATVVYGAVAALLIASTRNTLVRVFSLITAFVLISLVAFSRMYLGAHYLSDVIGAIAEGFAWLSLCLSVARYFRNRTKAGRMYAIREPER